MSKIYPLTGLFTFLLIFNVALAQQNSLREQIAQIARPAKGIVGVAIMDLESRDTITFNGNSRLVMQSVMKFPIALAVLHLVDTGKISLDQIVHISKHDLSKTPGPLRDKYPKGNIDLSIGDLLGYMVSQSDNNACDILLKKIGGTEVVQGYLLRLGIKGVAVNASEAEQASAWEVQYTNWCKPAEMAKLLNVFYQGNILSKSSRDFLLKIMAETSTGPNRLKGLLPVGTVIAHKTGSSSTNDAGLSPATNDVGIITLPNGRHLAIAIFVCNSTDDEATREGVIARIAKAAWDFYSKRS